MANVNVVGRKAGKTWDISFELVKNGTHGVKRDQVFNSFTETYIVRSDVALDNDDVLKINGIPEAGSPHSDYPALVVTGKRVTEGTGGESHIYNIEITYGRTQTTLSAKDTNDVPAGQDIQAWGWRSGTVSRELACEVGSPNPILNSARQPFESVPQYEVASPVFTKVFKRVGRGAGWVKYANCVNAAEFEIGGEKFPENTLRVIEVTEERLWNDPYGYEWQYTIGIQYLSNMVSIEGGESAVDIGWQLAITDAGCYELDDEGKLKRIAIPDSETGETTYATTPQLLDGNGKKLGNDGKPYNFYIEAYARGSFPDEFASDAPTIRKEKEDRDDTPGV